MHNSHPINPRSCQTCLHSILQQKSNPPTLRCKRDHEPHDHITAFPMCHHERATLSHLAFPWDICGSEGKYWTPKFPDLKWDSYKE